MNPSDPSAASVPPASPVTPATGPQGTYLENFPVAWFATVMGMSGFSIAWNRAEYFLDPGLCLSSVLLGVTTLWFLGVLLVYANKIIRHPAAVLAEIRHPVKQAFVPAFSISLILLSVAYLPFSPGFSFWLWIIGTVVHLGLTLFILGRWMHHPAYEIAHLHPGWFIPVVGNILIPIAGMQHGAPEISWFFFSLGLFFWPLLTALVFYRLVFQPALPAPLLPTLFIFIAPPAAGMISWFNLVGQVDGFARILYSIALVFTLLLFSQIRHFLGIRFSLSWWACSFPLAAVTIASFLMAGATGRIGYQWIGTGLLVVLSVVMLGLLWLTLRGLLRQEI